MAAIIFTEPNGTLLDYTLTRSRETPRYLQWIRPWMASLKGQILFGDAPLAGIQAVSGATMSSRAILRLLRESGQTFAAAVLHQGRSAESAATPWFRRVDPCVVYWGIGLVLALGAILHGRLWSRIMVLVYTAAAGGIWLNYQYSTDHVTRLLGGDGLFAASWSGLCLLLGVPLVIILLGNLFCGYLCPFGALQELFSFMVPRRWKLSLSYTTVTHMRFIKYVVLFVLVIAFFLSRNKEFLETDPLTSVFNRQFWSEGLLNSSALIIAVIALIAGLFVTRFWCRFLCPTGAFLSLLNLTGWVKRLLPAKKFGRCEFGLGGRDHLDCIYCDRCRYDNPHVPRRRDVIAASRPGILSRVALIVVLALAATIVTPALQRIPVPEAAPAVARPASPDAPPPGQSRDADPARLEQMIREGHLSDKEAMYYGQEE